MNTTTRNADANLPWHEWTTPYLPPGFETRILRRLRSARPTPIGSFAYAASWAAVLVLSAFVWTGEPAAQPTGVPGELTTALVTVFQGGAR